MMNEHYKKALVEATATKLREQDVKVTSCEVEEVLVNNVETAGNWQQDAQALYEACLRYVEDEEQPEEEDSESTLGDIVEEKKQVESKIAEITDSLKIGYNFIPGIGAGWCSNEEDLARMRDFVRGALTLRAMQNSMCNEFPFED